ncbi:FecCD family ABC transporter permease [Glutamicibacter ardleyensis]|uniref:FecCD family ABC transporter permease n=1 Tax=Glutamicibacter ardleyensis TaxID=225894 RepID=UPI003FB72881
MSAGLRDLAVDRPARKGLPVFVACAVALLLAVAASLLYGSQPVPAVDVLAYLRGQQGNLVEANASVMALRVPRTVLGLVCGISLGVAGALCQAHTRNPLADPGLLGVSSGAAAGVVLAISVFHLVSPAQYTVFGLLGGLVAGLMVLGLAARIRLANAATSLILAGSIITGVLNAVSSAVVLLDKVTMDRFRYWTVGSLSGRDASVLWDVGPWLALGLLLTVLNTSSLDALALGDDVASSLGRNVIRDRLVGLLAVVVLASAATASMGAIAFLGLAAPHLAKRIAPGGLPGAVWLSGALGGAIMLLADTAGRLVLPTGELSVGIMLAILGAPLFILIARSPRMRRAVDSL